MLYRVCQVYLATVDFSPGCSALLLKRHSGSSWSHVRVPSLSFLATGGHYSSQLARDCLQLGVVLGEALCKVFCGLACILSHSWGNPHTHSTDQGSTALSPGLKDNRAD